MILSWMSCVTSLGSLVRTCGVFHTVHLANRTALLCKVLLRQLHTDGVSLFPSSMTTWSLMQSEFPKGSENQRRVIIVLLNQYWRYDELGYASVKRLDIADCYHLIQMQNVAKLSVQES